jgi:hypothetical protein
MTERRDQRYVGYCHDQQEQEHLFEATRVFVVVVGIVCYCNIRVASLYRVLYNIHVALFTTNSALVVVPRSLSA